MRTRTAPQWVKRFALFPMNIGDTQVWLEWYWSLERASDPSRALQRRMLEDEPKNKPQLRIGA